MPALRVETFKLRRVPKCASHRGFSTTLARADIPPESPRFVEIPHPPQSTFTPRKRVKGFLPVPRELFPARTRNRDLSAHLAATAPKPRAPPAAQQVSSSSISPGVSDAGPAGQHNVWKRRLAALRRRNLAEGLSELSQRQERQQLARAQRSAERRAERTLALHRPPREDERLTAPTIPQALRSPQVGPLPDPDRAARLARKAANVRAAEAANRRKRIEALHTLYMNARSFIVTEEQLNARIERVFGEPAFNSRNRGLWDAGAPLSIQDKLGEIGKAKEQQGMVQKRLEQIAAELTGGTGLARIKN